MSESPENQKEKSQTENTSENIEETQAPEETFDPEVKRLMNLVETVKKEIKEDDVMLIIAKTGEHQPIVFVKGHPYDITEITARYIREMKEQLFNNLDC